MKLTDPISTAGAVVGGEFRISREKNQIKPRKFCAEKKETTRNPYKTTKIIFLFLRARARASTDHYLKWKKVSQVNYKNI